VRYIAATVVGTLLLIACVTPGDLRNLADIQEVSLERLATAQVDYQNRVEAILNDQSNDAETQTQQIRQAQDDLAREIKGIGETSQEDLESLWDEIKARNEALMSAGQVPLTGNHLMNLLLAAIGAAGVSIPVAERRVNKQRDAARLARGESTNPYPNRNV
jgi:hypothetical protein